LNALYFHNERAEQLRFVLKMLSFLPKGVAPCLKQLFLPGGPRFWFLLKTMWVMT